jgi:hypothetical protein
MVRIDSKASSYSSVSVAPEAKILPASSGHSHSHNLPPRLVGMDYCLGCSREFPSQRSLSVHRRFCQAYKTYPTTVLGKRRHNFEKAQAAVHIEATIVVDEPQVIQTIEPVEDMVVRFPLLGQLFLLYI